MCSNKKSGAVKKKTGGKKTKKRKRKLLAAAGVGMIGAGVISTMLVKAAMKEKPVLEVNGNPVYEEEYQILQKDHKDRKDMIRIRIEQELAVTYGVLEEPFSYQQLVADMEEENAERKRKQKAGEIIYGLTEFNINTYYDYFMSNLITQTISRIPDEKLSISDEMIDTYYQNLETITFVDGEILNYTLYDLSNAQQLNVEETNDVEEKAREQLLSGTDEQISVGNRQITATKVKWTKEDITRMIRQNMYAEEALLGLKKGGVSNLFNAGEQHLVVRYDGITKASVLKENDKGVFRQELREDAYWHMVEERVQSAKVQDYR